MVLSFLGFSHWETTMGFVIPLAVRHVETCIHLDLDVCDMYRGWSLFGGTYS